MNTVTTDQLRSLAYAYNDAIQVVANLDELKVETWNGQVSVEGNIPTSLLNGLTDLVNLDYHGNILAHIRVRVGATKPVDLLEGSLITRTTNGVCLKSHDARSLTAKVKNYLADCLKTAMRRRKDAADRLNEVLHVNP